MPNPIVRLLLCAACAWPAAAVAQPALLHSLFQDHAVLQRDRPIAVWGTAEPGEKVRVALGGNRAEATAGRDGAWRATLPAMPAGGPYTLEATGERGRTASAADVLIGDVWLCSGQSNMEMEVARSLNGPWEVSNAKDSETRILTISHDTSAAAKAAFGNPVRWQPVNPESIGSFSGVCWFMARDLRRSEKVPFGLIDASWGGTAIDPWRSEGSFEGDPAARDKLALLAAYRRDPAAASAEWGRVWGQWYRGATGDAAGSEPWQAGAPGDWKPLPGFGYWEGWNVPELAAYNGAVWYRTEVTLTPEQAAKPATLALGVMDDLDLSYVNGVAVGTTASWEAVRAYPLARGALKPGVNRIAIVVVDGYGPGGMAPGGPETRAIRFADGTSVALPEAARWQYRVAPPLSGRPSAPWESLTGIAGIYNAMIAPLGSYGLRGAAWYQGETDANSPAGYAGRLAGLMRGWRAQFGNPDLPFLIVQLPDWGARVTKPGESGFASIRDEQRRAVERDSRSGLAVTIDIGDPEDLHPANKQAVARRLAEVARTLTYGGTKRASGAWVTGAVRAGDTVTVGFDRFDGTLVTYSGAQVLGFELCGTAGGSCRFVSGRLDGAKVVLDAAGGPADRVRFCWGDSPVCNLYDSTGLPAGPFELEVR